MNTLRILGIVALVYVVLFLIGATIHYGITTAYTAFHSEAKCTTVTRRGGCPSPSGGGLRN